jgi:teichuronic acid biosynthesis glycosyltransferase TuaC
MDEAIRVLMLTSEWPTQRTPDAVPFIVRQVEFLRRAGVAVDVFCFRGAKNPLNYLRAWFQAQNKLRNNRYDLVHAQWGQSGLLAMPKRLPLVITFRGDDVEGMIGSNGKYTLNGYILRKISRSLARRADALIVVSAHMKRHLLPLSAHVIPSGLDLDRFAIIPQQAARQRLGLPLDRRLVLFVCNPSDARKRYPLSQRAVSLLDPALNAQLVVAWRVPHAAIPLFMNAADALIFTSLLEGSPNAVKEALACDLPVVSVAVGDVPERLSGLDNCVVCADDRPETIARELTQVLLRQERAKSRPSVLDLDERVLTQRLIDIYLGILREVPTRGQIHTRSLGRLWRTDSPRSSL